MSTEKAENKGKIAWGITGSGDRLAETIRVMEKTRKQHQNETKVQVYLSKAGKHVAEAYGVFEKLKESFDKVMVEFSSNVPFLAGQLQTGTFDFLLIAPATSNTVAKISLGIADSLLTNAAIMALKGFVPVYIMPCDRREGIIVTRLPNGRKLKLKMRKEDVENTNRLRRMENVFVLKKPEEIYQVFEKHFGAGRRL